MCCCELVKVWSLEKMLPIQTLHRHTLSVNTMVINRDTLLSGSEDTEIKVTVLYLPTVTFITITSFLCSFTLDEIISLHLMHRPRWLHSCHSLFLSAMGICQKNCGWIFTRLLEDNSHISVLVLDSVQITAAICRVWLMAHIGQSHILVDTMSASNSVKIKKGQIWTAG